MSSICRRSDKLLSISSDAIGEEISFETAHQYLSPWGALGKELAELLCQRNGFFAYESALLVRPLQRKIPPLGLLEWNDFSLWKQEFAEHIRDVLFFAEDVFGVQFCVHDANICMFDPETGSLESTHSSLDAWARDLMADYCVQTGYSLGHDWQVKNAPLPLGVRLLPKTPFVLGGEYETANLYPLEDVKGMRFRACIANQIRDLPDGASVVIDIG